MSGATTEQIVKEIPRMSIDPLIGMMNSSINKARKYEDPENKIHPAEPEDISYFYKQFDGSWVLSSYVMSSEDFLLLVNECDKVIAVNTAIINICKKYQAKISEIWAIKF